MTEKIEPCPFCGGSAFLWEPKMRGYHDMHPKYREPACGQCAVAMGFYPSAAEAIAAWNRRAPTTDALPGEGE